MFGWCDLATHDVEGAADFYGALLGWDCAPVEHADRVVYRMFTLEGDNVAGLVDNRGWGEEPDVPPPPMWISYIIVDDVDALAPRVEELGGVLLRPPMDVMESGRTAFVQDPTGATVGLWQPREHAGADRFNEPGALTWNELATDDVDAALTFYRDLLGWRWTADDMPGLGRYHMAKVGGRDAAGLYALSGEMAGMPPRWTVYLQVDDVDATATRAAELGGQVPWPPQDIAVGRFAVLADPAGGHFCVFAPPASG